MILFVKNLMKFDLKSKKFIAESTMLLYFVFVKYLNSHRATTNLTITIR